MSFLNFIQSHLPSGSHGSEKNASLFTLNIDIESPPITLLGTPRECSGSLLSGLFTLYVKDLYQEKSSSSSLKPHKSNSSTLVPVKSSSSLTPVKSSSSISSALQNHSNKGVEITSVTLTLNQIVVRHKPFVPPSNTLSNCAECKKKVTELARWDILSHSAFFPFGKHVYPFSHLIPGSLPATCHLGAVGSTKIQYELVAIAKSKNHEAKVVLPLNVSRSILKAQDKLSLRVFPPTSVTANVFLPNVIYPKSVFDVKFLIEQLADDEKIWRMKKFNWRIEETVKIKSASCDKHKAKLRLVEDYTKRNNNLRIKPSIPSSGYGSISTSAVVTETLQDPPVNSGSDSNNANDTDNANGTSQLSPSASNIDNPGASSSQSNQGVESTQTSEANTKKPKKLALYLEEIRTVSHGEFRKGWKSDYSGTGTVEFQASIDITNTSTGNTNHIAHVSSDSPPLAEIGRGANIACSVDDPNLGIHVSHVMVVEIVIAEEVRAQKIHKLMKLDSKPTSTSTTSLQPSISNNTDANNAAGNTGLSEISPLFANNGSNPPTLGTSHSSESIPTGSARVLRMEFKLAVTERSGLGISWDDEVPPVYEDVSTLSPPTYNSSIASSSNTQTGRTPGVIYGFGDTPCVNPRTPHYNLDVADLDDRIQDLTL